jgi:hypothetical protein
VADATKRTECVKVCMPEQMLLDLNRQAVREDRKLSDYLYLILRRYAYGNLDRDVTELEGQELDTDGR